MLDDQQGSDSEEDGACGGSGAVTRQGQASAPGGDTVTRRQDAAPDVHPNPSPRDRVQRRLRSGDRAALFRRRNSPCPLARGRPRYLLIGADHQHWLARQPGACPLRPEAATDFGMPDVAQTRTSERCCMPYSSSRAVDVVRLRRWARTQTSYGLVKRRLASLTASGQTGTTTTRATLRWHALGSDWDAIERGRTSRQARGRAPPRGSSCLDPTLLMHAYGPPASAVQCGLIGFDDAPRVLSPSHRHRATTRPTTVRQPTPKKDIVDAVYQLTPFSSGKRRTLRAAEVDDSNSVLHCSERSRTPSKRLVKARQSAAAERSPRARAERSS